MRFNGLAYDPLKCEWFAIDHAIIQSAIYKNPESILLIAL